MGFFTLRFSTWFFSVAVKNEHRKKEFFGHELIFYSVRTHNETCSSVANWDQRLLTKFWQFLTKKMVWPLLLHLPKCHLYKEWRMMVQNYPYYLKHAWIFLFLWLFIFCIAAMSIVKSAEEIDKKWSWLNTCRTGVSWNLLSLLISCMLCVIYIYIWCKKMTEH